MKCRLYYQRGNAFVPDLREPEADGLVIPEVGEWSRDKHHFLLRYIDAFTTAMRNKRWQSLHYIDLFAGAGIERLKKTHRLDWGSPLIAAQTRYPFTGLHLCEKNPEKHHALEARLNRLSSPPRFRALVGDANDKVGEIVVGIPPKSLSLAFLDPYGLHLDYRTLEELARIRADLIVYFPDRVDADRNWRAYYCGNPDSNLDRVLGPGVDWRPELAQAPSHRRTERLLRLYQSQISKLGYAEFEWEPIPSSRARLYWLIFCSRHKAGSKIWRAISQKKPDSQQTFDFGAP